MSFIIVATECFASQSNFSCREFSKIYYNTLDKERKAYYQGLCRDNLQANTLYAEEVASNFQKKAVNGEEALGQFYKQLFVTPHLLLDVIKAKLAHTRFGKKNKFFAEYSKLIEQEYPGQGMSICSLAACKIEDVHDRSLLKDINNARTILRESMPADLIMAIKHLNNRSYDEFVSYLFGYFEGRIVFSIESLMREGIFQDIDVDTRIEMFTLLDNVLFVIIGFANSVKVLVEDQRVVDAIDSCVRMQAAAFSCRLVRAFDLTGILGYETSISQAKNSTNLWRKNLLASPGCSTKSDGVTTEEDDFSDKSTTTSPLFILTNKPKVSFSCRVLPCAVERDRAAREIQLSWQCRPSATAATWRDVGNDEIDVMIDAFEALTFG